jgi:hypothetical protein
VIRWALANQDVIGLVLFGLCAIGWLAVAADVLP